MTLSSTTSRRRILVALATLLAATAIAVASGASFNSSTANAANVVATGSLDMLNDQTVIFANDNMKPGDWITGDVTITNDSTIPAAFTLAESGTNPFGSNAALTIEDESGTVFAGTLGSAGSRSLGTWDVGEARTFTFTVRLSDNTPNTQQGLSATTAYTWTSVQTAGEAVINER